ncbi:abortive infection protein [Fibrobacteres bacterium R8-0-B4]
MTIHINCLNSKTDSSPPHVLNRMKEYIADKGLKETDEAWLVVDKDQWTDEQLKILFDWAQTRNNYGFALSNPKFEYWLLLHFEDGDGVTTSADCDNRLKRNIPNYDKDINFRAFTRERIDKAIDRAKQRDKPCCKDWPRNPGGTTVYKLVERIVAG